MCLGYISRGAGGVARKFVYLGFFRLKIAIGVEISKNKVGRRIIGGKMPTLEIRLMLIWKVWVEVGFDAWMVNV